MKSGHFFPPAADLAAANINEELFVEQLKGEANHSAVGKARDTSDNNIKKTFHTGGGEGRAVFESRRLLSSDSLLLSTSTRFTKRISFEATVVGSSSMT
jgi:hypothetical protein